MITYDQALEACVDYFGGDRLAATAVVDKYLLKSQEGIYLERDPSDIHKRLAKEFARIEAKFGGPRQVSYDDIYAQLDHFKKIIPQGSPMYGIGNPRAVSLSNCVVVDSPDDNISSILNKGRDIANLFKRRAGVGLDLSTLRPDKSVVSNSAGTTSGAWSFADLYSYICLMIGQNSRRGALMLSMDVKHPDIYKFVTMKQDLKKVTGANISVKIHDDFMHAVETDSTYTLQWPVDSDTPKIKQEIQARDLWNTIIKSATDTAEPGILMWDTMMRELPAECYSEKGFKSQTVNPCAELVLSGSDSCRLISLNLNSFVTDPYTVHAQFDFENFRNTVTIAQRLCDNLVELECEKLQQILNTVDTEDEKTLWGKLYTSCVNGRRTGLGTVGLADTLASLQIVYASTESLEIVSDIYRILRDTAYTESVELAVERGSFPVWDWELEKHNAFLNRLPEDLIEKMSKVGRRNISLLTNAPTGTVSLCTQTSSGIEPIFRLSYIRRKKILDDTTEADYVDPNGDRWQEFQVYHPGLIRYAHSKGIEDLSTMDIPDYFVSSDKIDYMRRIEIQSIIQQYIDHGVSSTINLPKGTKYDTVEQLYMTSWQKGLKGITVYVDGSRSGILVEHKEIATKDAPKRPKDLPCEIFHKKVRGERWTILVGLLNDVPYEIFAGPSDLISISDKYTNGMIIKNPRKTINSRYDLYFGDGDCVKDIAQEWFDGDSNYGTLSRMVSMSLRHGVPIQFLVEQLQKDSNDDLWSFNRVLARVLKKWIVDGTKRDKICPSCGDDSGLIYQEGCLSCQSCGYSKCG